MPRFFDDFPYTNLNDLNLDWIVETMRAMQEEIEDLQTRVTALEEGGETP